MKVSALGIDELIELFVWLRTLVAQARNYRMFMLIEVCFGCICCPVSSVGCGWFDVTVVSFSCLVVIYCIVL